MGQAAAAVEVSSKPYLVEDLSGITTAACGADHAGYVTGGQLFTYGSNKYHQLGHAGTEGGNATGSEPQEVVLEAEDGYRPKVLDVALGAFHSAAITEGGVLWTWGWGGSFWYGVGALGQGGNETVESPRIVDRFVDEGVEVSQVACGHQHTLVLTKNGRLFTTGKGDFGRLGRGDTRDEPEFEEIEYFSQAYDSVLQPDDVTSVVKIGCGNNFSAALSWHGELWVWGRNDYGQLGLGEEAMGDMYSAERYPRLVRSLPLEGHRIVDFACGEYHVVVLTAAGALYEWGNRNWLEPHPVSLPSRYQNGLKDIRKIVAGEKFTFALTEEGRVYAWGAKTASACLALDGEPRNVVEPTLVSPDMFAHQRVVDIFAKKARCIALTQEDSYIA